MNQKHTEHQISESCAHRCCCKQEAHFCFAASVKPNKPFQEGAAVVGTSLAGSPPSLFILYHHHHSRHSAPCRHTCLSIFAPLALFLLVLKLKKEGQSFPAQPCCRCFCCCCYCCCCSCCCCCCCRQALSSPRSAARRARSAPQPQPHCLAGFLIQVNANCIPGGRGQPGESLTWLTPRIPNGTACLKFA